MRNYWSTAPWDTRAIAEGFHYVVFGPDLRLPQVAVSFITRRSLIARSSLVIAQFMRAMAEAAKILHTDKEVTFKVLGKYLRVDDRKILEAGYNAEIKALEPRMELKLDALEAILDDVAQVDPRARQIKAAELYDRRYLDELEKSGFFEKLWGGAVSR